MLSRELIESRIEREGLETAVLDVLSSLEGLAPEQRLVQIEALQGACGTTFGDNNAAWEQWLQTLRNQGVVGFGPIKPETRQALPSDGENLADMIQECVQADEQAGRAPGEIDAPLGKIGKFLLTGEIGRGGMGIVYLGHDTMLNRDVAVKVLPKPMAERAGSGQQDTTAVDRFLREARLAAQLVEPEIVQVFECGEADDQIYLAMEYVEGQSLQRQIDREGSIPVARALEITRAIARALRAAFEKKSIIHRDIKPDNVLITRDGRVKVADFGLAKTVGAAAATDFTNPRSALGTLQYMAPEQYEDAKSVGHRADIFALGATLYHQLAGKRPFEGDTIAEIYVKVSRIDPDPLPEHVPLPVRELVARMLAKKPEDRFQTYDALLEAVEQAGKRLPSGVQTIVREPLASPTPSPKERAPAADGSPPEPATAQTVPMRLERRLPVGAWVGGFLVLAILIAVAVWAFGRPSSAPIAEPPKPERKVASLLKSAASFRQAGLPEKAREALSEALMLDPDHPAVNRQLREIQAELAAREAQSQRAFEYKTWMDQALRLKLAGKLKEAAEAYVKAAEFAPEGSNKAADLASKCLHDHYKARANEAVGHGDLRSALGLFEKALEERDDPVARRALETARTKVEREDWLTKAREAESDDKLPKAIASYQEAAKRGAPVDDKIVFLKAELNLRLTLADVSDRIRKQAWQKAAKSLTGIPPDRRKDPRVASLIAQVRKQLLPPQLSGPLGIQLVLVPGGTFQMGWAEGESAERPVHPVEVSSFYLGRFEVTRAQFEAFRAKEAEKPVAASPRDHEPVASITWHQADDFCRYVSEIDPGRARYHLPTEAQWEFAARGPSGQVYPWGDDPPMTRHANLLGADDGYEGLAPVGRFPDGATTGGIMDLVGNAAEWCRDWYGPYSAKEEVDPTGPERGTKRVVRGSAFKYSASTWSRAAMRVRANPDTRHEAFGFRVVRELTPTQREFVREWMDE